MKIGIVGAGYVGLVTGSCLAEFGNRVTIYDIDSKKINSLNAGKCPIFEPGLSELIQRNLHKKSIVFTSHAFDISKTEIVFICVGTPQADDGSTDLSYTKAAVKTLDPYLNTDHIVILKSTVPPGTAKLVRSIFEKAKPHVVNNPEFLKEGDAINDFMKPDRVVLGYDYLYDYPAIIEKLKDLYAPFVRTGNPIILMDNISAELTKYAANGFLATKISYMNEIARVCDVLGADVEAVRQGISYDERIGNKFLFPGIGYGGSCFPKDVKSIIHESSKVGEELAILSAADRVNKAQKHYFMDKIFEKFDDLENKIIGVWGLAFKPNTDDIREAPSLYIVNELLEEGAFVHVYDPKAKDTFHKEFGNHKKLVYSDNMYSCCLNADALILVTEWGEFRNPDFNLLSKIMKEKRIFDGRNIYDKDKVNSYGFKYIGIGR